MLRIIDHLAGLSDRDKHFKQKRNRLIPVPFYLVLLRLPFAYGRHIIDAYLYFFASFSALRSSLVPSQPMNIIIMATT